MNVYSIDDVLDYITCPYKLTHSGEPETILPPTVSACLTEVYEETFKFMLSRLLINNRVKLSSMNKHFNKLWSEKSKKVKVKKTPQFLFKVHNKVLGIWNLLPNDVEVIAYKYPCVKQYGKGVVQGELDAVLYDRKNNRIQGIHCINPNITDSKSSDYYVETLGSYFLDCLTEDFGDTSEVSVSLMNMDVISRYRWTYRDINSVLANVISAIEAEIFYPRNVYQICNNCSYRNSCNRRSK